MKLEYIKAGGRYFEPTPPKIEQIDSKFRTGIYKPVCYIEELDNGLWQVKYFNDQYGFGEMGKGSNQKPSHVLILYPSGIEEISYTLQE